MTAKQVLPHAQGMIPEKLAPDLIRGAKQFSEKIMPKQENQQRGRFNEVESDPSAMVETIAASDAAHRNARRGCAD